jgi:hypothetical protein
MEHFHRLLRNVRTATGLVGLVAGVTAGLTGTAGAQVLPPNPDPTCVVTPDVFSTWFDSGTPGLDQPVKPADSITLDTSNNCNFYKWSEQMFLWLASPEPKTGPYGGGRVFDSNVFYQISNGSLVAQNTLGPRNFAIRAAQAGADGLPVIIDSAGHLREFVTAPSRSGINTLGVTGKRPAEIATIETRRDGKAVFHDARGKVVPVTPKVTADMLPQTLGRLERLTAPPKGRSALSATDERQRIADALTAAKVLIQFDTTSGQVFVEAGTGIVDNLGPGQAGGNGVLISQRSSVIFYETLVNDVYAWYLTGRKTPGGIAPTYDSTQPTSFGLFPTSAPDLKQIEDFSASHGGPQKFPDGQALAIEAKLAWVDASTLPANGAGYIITKANVPTYNMSSSTDWAPNGSRLIDVALVGVHVVGSTKGHPEMIWATFEHSATTPLDKFDYKSGGKVVPVARNTTGTWVLSANGAPEPYNVELAALCPNQTAQCSPEKSGHIVAMTAAGILPPANILRTKPWGVAAEGVPNQQDKTPADSNTEIISLDTNVQSQLSAAGAGTDPRYNYLLIGATWTFGGGQPSGAYPKNPPIPQNPPKFDEIGTSMLANSTMETFQQGGTGLTGTNCFSCHNNLTEDPKTKADTSVSHIFDGINPLAPSTQLRQ